MNFSVFLEKFQKVPVRHYPGQQVDAPLVSVCVQTYQHARYLRTCLDSILFQQVNFPFEILIGEDESSDNTREICIEYANRYPSIIRLFLHSRKNNIHINGAPSGRFSFVYNLFMARGRYIALCEGDDYWTDRNKLQKQVELLEKQKHFVLCYHAFDVVNELNRPIELQRYNDKNTPPPDFSYNLNHYLLYKNIKTLTVVYRREVLGEEELLNVLCANPIPSSGDIPLIFLILTKGDGVFVPESMGTYRIHPGGITNSNRVTNDSLIVTAVKLYPYITDSTTKALIKRRLRYALKRSIINFDFSFAVKICRAFNYWPV